MSTQTVTINGRQYDRYTGLPIDENVGVASDQHHAHSVHQGNKRSQTLDRRYVKRSAPKPVNTPPPATQPKMAKTIPVTAAPSPEPTVPHHTISKFAPKPTPKPSAAPKISEAAPRTHPMVQAVHAARAKPQKSSVPKPSDIIKAEAVEQALADAPSHQNTQRARMSKPKKAQRGKSRLATLATAGAALLLLGGYFTYLNMPNLSVRVAAAQAGIEAGYPSYRPSGYSISGPVAYESGRVRMKFAANGGPQSFFLNQERSGWDSEAVLENYVVPKAGDDYTITRDSGMTLYTWGDDAAWINNGILYSIDGDAPIAPDQVRRMATSL